MEKVNYLEIFKQAWKTTWERKYLWWLGLFAGSGSSLSFNISGDFQKEFEKNGWSEKVAAFSEAHIALILGVVLFLVMLFVALALIRILAFSGLIRSFLGIEKGENKTVRALFADGKKFFARVLAIRVLTALSILVLLLVLALPVTFLFLLKSFVLGGLAALLAFLILIPAMISLAFVSHYGSLYVVTSDLSVRDSLEQGCKIFSKNIWPSILMALLFFPINILAGIAFVLPLIAIAIPVAVLGFIFYQLFSVAGIWIVGTVAGLLALSLLLLFRSILSVFYHSAWLLFFRSIAKVKKEEVAIKEELVIEKAIPEKA